MALEWRGGGTCCVMSINLLSRKQEPSEETDLPALAAKRYGDYLVTGMYLKGVAARVWVKCNFVFKGCES